MAAMSLLITGAGGLVGSALTAILPPGAGVGLTRSQLDITDGDRLRRTLDRLQPRAVINAAAQANVDLAETEIERTTAVNAHAVGLLAALCRTRGIRLVHLSTDYVLDYPDQEELTEDLAPNPRSAYARSKHAGEDAALSSGADVVVVRVQWVYQPGERGFFNAALRRLREGQPLHLVVDQVGRPTPASLLAPALLTVAQGGPAGLFHLACSGEVSAWGWIAAAAQRAGLPLEATPTTRAALGGAHRPARSCLSAARFAAAWPAIGPLPPWEAALQQVM